MKYVFIVLAMLACTACTQPETATRILQGAGYTSIEMHGYDLFSCSKDDTYHDSFTAIGPNGQRISGVVCSGLIFKNSTIRFD